MRFKILVNQSEINRLKSAIKGSILTTSDQVVAEYGKRGVEFLRKAEQRAGPRRHALARGWRASRPIRKGNAVEVLIDNAMVDRKNIPVRSNAKGRKITGTIDGNQLVSILVWGAGRHDIAGKSGNMLVWDKRTEGRIFGGSAFTERGFGRAVSKRAAIKGGTYRAAMSVQHPGVRGSHSIAAAEQVLNQIDPSEVWRKVEVSSR